MALPVRVNEDNYANLQQEADRERRSATAQLNFILDERYHRNTTGVAPKIEEVKDFVQRGQAAQARVDDLITPEKNASEANASGVFTPAEDVKHVPDVTTLEQPCCQNETQPCKHWVWDTQTGEGYRNVLSGRLLEVD